jgi:hypothetical protein
MRRSEDRVMEKGREKKKRMGEDSKRNKEVEVLESGEKDDGRRSRVRLVDVWSQFVRGLFVT